METSSPKQRVINLYLIAKEVYVWNTDDWLELRKKHRIIGCLTGSLPRSPFQEVMNGLPARYLPEEAAFLIKRGICRLVRNVGCMTPSRSRKALIKDFNERITKEEIEFIKADKRANIVKHLDTIVEGKRRKLLSEAANKGHSTEITIDREEVLRKELKKADRTELNHHLQVTFTEDPFKRPEDLREVNWVFFHTKEEELKFKVFEDLWSRGYYLTSGGKFGGDFLVYPGDPLQFHAHFVVQCLVERTIAWTDIALFARVATNAKKTLVLATVDDSSNTVNYKSIQFTSLSTRIM